MFWQRLISSMIVLGVTIAVMVLGGDILFFGLLAISLIGLMEFYRTMKLNKSMIGILGYVACILYYLLIYFKLEDFNIFFVILFLMLIMSAYVISFPKYHTEQVTFVFFGLFYIALMLSFIYKVRMLEEGIYLVWLIFISAWGSDTSAYCVGMLFGKTKFLPNLSPKKSLEGCIGGVLGAGLLGFLYGFIFKDLITGISNPGIVFAITCAVASIISQLGDLAASAIKRNHEIKDYGRLIPGHGGILDRFDSIIFVSPVVYYFITLI